MTDHLQAYADHLDREPRCTCVTTDRGVDVLGCELHDTEPRATAGAAGAGEGGA